MSAPSLVLVHLHSTRHALRPGGNAALCGVRLEDPPEQAGAWPGAGGALCRECARAAASSTSTVSFAARRRRPGGMG